LNKRSR